MAHVFLSPPFTNFFIFSFLFLYFNFLLFFYFSSLDTTAAESLQLSLHSLLILYSALSCRVLLLLYTKTTCPFFDNPKNIFLILSILTSCVFTSKLKSIYFPKDRGHFYYLLYVFLCVQHCSWFVCRDIPAFDV